MNECSNKNKQDNRLEHFKRIRENAVFVLKFRRSVVLLQSEMRQDGFWRWRMALLYAAIWSADGNRVSVFIFKSISVAYCAIDCHKSNCSTLLEDHWRNVVYCIPGWEGTVNESGTLVLHIQETRVYILFRRPLCWLRISIVLLVQINGGENILLGHDHFCLHSLNFTAYGLSYHSMFFVGPVAQSVLRLVTGWTVRASNPGGGRDFPHLFRPALAPTQTPVQWVPGPSRGYTATGAWRWPLTSF
jgi:hypothetical protein